MRCSYLRRLAGRILDLVGLGEGAGAILRLDRRPPLLLAGGAGLLVTVGLLGAALFLTPRPSLRVKPPGDRAPRHPEVHLQRDARHPAIGEAPSGRGLLSVVRGALSLWK